MKIMKQNALFDSILIILFMSELLNYLFPYSKIKITFIIDFMIENFIILIHYELKMLFLLIFESLKIQFIMIKNLIMF